MKTFSSPVQCPSQQKNLLRFPVETGLKIANGERIWYQYRSLYQVKYRVTVQSPLQCRCAKAKEDRDYHLRKEWLKVTLS